MIMRHLLRSIIGLCVLLGAAVASADEFRPGYLELREQDTEIYDVFWKIPAQGGQPRPGIEIVFPADTFNLSEPRGASTPALTPTLAAEASRRPDWPDGPHRRIARGCHRHAGARATIRRLQPGNAAAAVRSGIRRRGLRRGSGSGANLSRARRYEHILLGIDHLLFVLALLLIVKGVGRVVATVTAFTIAHSITLAAATLGWCVCPPRRWKR